MFMYTCMYRHSKSVSESLFQVREDEIGQYSEEEGADNSHVSRYSYSSTIFFHPTAVLLALHSSFSLSLGV